MPWSGSLDAHHPNPPVINNTGPLSSALPSPFCCMLTQNATLAPWYSSGVHNGRQVGDAAAGPLAGGGIALPAPRLCWRPPCAARAAQRREALTPDA